MRQIRNSHRYLVGFLGILTVLTHLGCSKECSLDLAHAPELRGFRLGTTLAQLRTRFPMIPEAPPSQLGRTTISIDPASMAADINPTPSYLSGAVFLVVNSSKYPELVGTTRTNLELVDGRLASIEILYSNDVKWTSIDEFLKTVADGLHLDGSWKKVGEDNEYSQHRSMTCQTLSIMAGFKSKLDSDTGARQRAPYVKLENFMETIQPMLREYNKNENENRSRKEQEEQKRKSFQP